MSSNQKEQPSLAWTKRVWKKTATNGDLYGPAMNIQSEAEATQYLVDLTHWTVRHFGGDYKTAWDKHLESIGYFAGYFDEATQARVEKVFKAKHPIFGSVKYPFSGEAAFKAGQAFAEGGEKAARRVIAISKRALKKAKK